MNEVQIRISSEHIDPASGKFTRNVSTWQNPASYDRLDSVANERSARDDYRDTYIEARILAAEELHPIHCYANIVDLQNAVVTITLPEDEPEPEQEPTPWAVRHYSTNTGWVMTGPFPTKDEATTWARTHANGRGWDLSTITPPSE